MFFLFLEQQKPKTQYLLVLSVFQSDLIKKICLVYRHRSGPGYRGVVLINLLD